MALVIADTATLWGLFTGVVLWASSKNSLDNEKDHLRSTFNLAYEVFERGITQSPE